MTEYDEFVSSAMTYPKDTAEVQVIVRWANKYKIPVYPISIGRNLGYGGAARNSPSLETEICEFPDSSACSRKCSH